MDKAAFVRLLEGLKRQREHDQECSALLERVFPDAMCMLWDNSKTEEAIIFALECEMNDREIRDGGGNILHGGWIRYFIDDLNFGANDHLYIIDKGKEIHLKTPENLFDYLTASNLRD